MRGRLIQISTGALLALQALLVVSGGAVRLTGSGLGCPTWPECTKGSYVPIKGQSEGSLHSWIEFGNRLLTFVLVFFAAIALLSIWNKRPDLRKLAIFQVLGIFGQGVLGGITVLTNLNPIPVAGHFILSIFLISGATSFYLKRNRRIEKISDSLLSKSHLVLAFLVIVAGTLVTGSGPHAGDLKSPRFPFQIQSVAWLHSGLVIGLLVITAIYYFKFRNLSREILAFLAVTLLQGLIGITQFNLGVPILLVAIHMLGASLFWIFTWKLRFASVTRAS